MSNVTRARDHFCDVIEKTIAETVLGDPVAYDLGPCPMPLPDGSGMAICYVLILSCRSPVLVPGRIAVNDIIWDGHPGDEQLRKSVTSTIEQLFEIRRQLASQRHN